MRRHAALAAAANTANPPKGPALSTLDPKELACRIILSHAKDVEFLSIGEMTWDDAEKAGLADAEFDELKEQIDDLIRNATVTVTFPGDPGTTTAAQLIRAFADEIDRGADIPLRPSVYSALARERADALQIGSDPGQAGQILDVPMGKNAAGAETIRDYLIALLATLLRQGEDFSSKRPFGSSGWEGDLEAALGRAGLVRATFDEDGYLEDVDSKRAEELIASAIRALGPAPAADRDLLREAANLIDALDLGVESDGCARLVRRIRAQLAAGSEAR